MAYGKGAVVCAVGHKTEPGYAVCKHVLAGAVATRVLEPDAEAGRLGLVFCDSSLEHSAGEMTVACAECCRVNGWVPRDRRLGLQAIREVKADDLGYEVTLACGHTVWSAIDMTGWPGTHCGGCMGELADELRAKHKRLREE